MAELAADSFTRADAASLGANWTNKRNSPGIFSNQVDCDTGSDENIAYWSALAWPDDGYAEAANVLVSNAGRSASVGYRMPSGANRNGYYAGYDGPNLGHANRAIWSWNGAALDEIVIEAVSVAAGAIVRIRVEGTTLAMFVDGVEEIANSDATFSSGNAGLYVNAAVDTALLDDWSGGNFLAAFPTHRTRYPRPLDIQSLAADEDEGMSPVDVRNWW
jgi:hypothetical protein